MAASDRIASLNTALEGRYRVESELGAGGMGVVYRAEDVRHARQVALKVLPPELSRELGAARFLREIRIAAGLSHRNIVPLFDSGDADGQLYFVMPLVRGESLRARLDREGSLPVDDAVRIAVEIGEGLGAAHAAGIVHRDVKPGNVLLESGHALVADFGVARAVDAAAGDGLTRSGIAVGTTPYMSPEQASGSVELDGRSDLYALGCLTYEMLVGEPPFTGATPQAVLAGHLTRAPTPIAERRPEVPPGLARVVERALAKDPADRFATAEEMVAALERAMTAEAQAAELRRAARRRWAGVAGAAVALLVLGVTGSWLAERATAPAIERLAVLPASNMTRDPEQDFFVDGVHEALVSELQRAGIATKARQSVLRFRDSELPLEEIARQLGVDGIIQPAVGREGDSVFVDVSLFDARTELPVWTASFTTETQGVIGLYREISGRVAEEIGAALSAEARERLAERPEIDPRVTEQVYAGEFERRQFTPDALDRALAYFEAAIEIDSTYAPAHLGVAAIWASRAQVGLAPPRVAFPLMRAALDRTLALDPTLPAAIWREGTVKLWHEWDLDAGLGAMRRGLELDPNDAQSRALFGHALMIDGRFEEALAEGERARRDDPLNPFVEGLYGVLLNGAGRPEEAVELMTDLQRRFPGAAFGTGPLLRGLEELGRLDEALEMRRAFHGRFPGVTEALDEGFAAGGYPEAMARAAERMAELYGGEIFVSALDIVDLNAEARRLDEAMR